MGISPDIYGYFCESGLKVEPEFIKKLMKSFCRDSYMTLENIITTQRKSDRDPILELIDQCGTHETAATLLVWAWSDISDQKIAMRILERSIAVLVLDELLNDETFAISDSEFVAAALHTHRRIYASVINKNGKDPFDKPSAISKKKVERRAYLEKVTPILLDGIEGGGAKLEYLCSHLKEKGIKTPTGKSDFHPETVRRIIRDSDKMSSAFDNAEKTPKLFDADVEASLK